MAPEVHRKRAYGAPVDVFAYGVVLRKLLSRVQPPPAGSLLRHVFMPALYALTTSNLAYQKIHCSPTVHPAWPPYMAELVRECCAADPAARPTFKDVLRRLASNTPPSGDT